MFLDVSRCHYFPHVTPCTYFIRESLNGLVMHRYASAADLIAAMVIERNAALMVIKSWNGDHPTTGEQIKKSTKPGYGASS